MVKIIKLFEIKATYEGLTATWDTIADKFSRLTDVSDYKLMKADSGNSDFGFAAVSKWTSLESFRENLAKDLVLKYHFMGNGTQKNHSASNVYKLVDEKLFSDKNDEISNVYLYFINDVLFLNDVKQLWNSRVSSMNSENGLVSSELFKSMYSNSNPSYLYTLNFSGEAYEQNEFSYGKYSLLDL
jgi:hypothetical protein